MLLFHPQEKCIRTARWNQGQLLAEVSPVNESEDDQDPSVEEIASRLRGKTLKVYWFLLRHPQPTTLRDIQKGTGLSSPSLASYHLDKLKELELVGEDNHGQFILKRNVKVGILRFFAGSGRLLVPRYLFYAVFYSTLLMVCFIFNLFRFGPISVLLLLVLSFGVLTSWVETIRTWKIKI